MQKQILGLMWTACLSVMTSVLGQIPRSGVVGTHAKYVFNFIRNFCMAFQSDYHFAFWSAVYDSSSCSTSLAAFGLVSAYFALYCFSSVQSLSRVWLFATPWTAARQVSLSITNLRSPPKPMPTELVMPSNNLILCRPLLLLPSIFPSIRVFSNESALRIRWPK